ncbi:MAG: hypothetical protein QOE51_172 [Actinoplanes sp.]|nr:hypothetical protein [Actinoplanes sp.]
MGTAEEVGRTVRSVVRSGWAQTVRLCVVLVVAAAAMVVALLTAFIIRALVTSQATQEVPTPRESAAMAPGLDLPFRLGTGGCPRRGSQHASDARPEFDRLLHGALLTDARPWIKKLI